MLTAIIFIIVLGVLIFVHELGHFVTAKKSGMKVEEFGFGFPPRAFGIQIFEDGEINKTIISEKITIEKEIIESRQGEVIVENITDEIKESQEVRGKKWHFIWGHQEPLDKKLTVYSINWIPFGGFVKILGEDGEERSNKQSFSAAKPGIKALVIVAGVLMNLLLAVVLLSLNNAIGFRIGFADSQNVQGAEDLKVQVVQIVSGSPAEKSGLKILDQISGVKIGNVETKITEVSKLQDLINANKGKEIILEIQEGVHMSEAKITPRANPPTGEGPLGISLALTGVVKYPWYQAIWEGTKATGYTLEQTVLGYGMILKNIFTKGSPGMDITGPVGIAVVTGQAARLGFTYLMQLMALISINLAVLNILPFPALDGGRLLFIIIEKIKGSPIPKKIETVVNSLGFALLVLLMIYITTKDVIKLF